MKEISAVRSSDTSASCRFYCWWPILLGPIVMILMCVTNEAERWEIFSKSSNESLALLLVGSSLVLFALQAIIFRSEFHLFMAVLCAAFFCREWHFAGTSTGIYVALVLLGIWAVIRRVEFTGIIGKGHLRIWLIAMMATYLLSQLIARRVFKHIPLFPHEAQLHIPLEETVETLAHLTMIVVCIISLKAGLRKKG